MPPNLKPLDNFLFVQHRRRNDAAASSNPNSELAVVASVGEKVEGFKPGDKVILSPRARGYALLRYAPELGGEIWEVHRSDVEHVQ